VYGIISFFVGPVRGVKQYVRGREREGSHYYTAYEKKGRSCSEETLYSDIGEGALQQGLATIILICFCEQANPTTASFPLPACKYSLLLRSA